MKPLKGENSPRNIMTPFWYITLLQEITIRPTVSEAVARRFRSQKAAALLAFLAYYRGRSFSREFLCEMLWPEEEEQTTRNRLRVTLASLRRQLEPPGVPFGAVLETVGNGSVRLRREMVTTDVALFEDAVKKGDATRATELYHSGPLLPGVYEDWVVGERQRLEELFEGVQGRSQETGDRRQEEREGERSASGERAVASVPGEVITLVPLPTYLTRFIGRDAVRNRLRTLFADPAVRLVTLTGSGGSGKTRLVVEAVKTDVSLRAFVPLADLWDAERLGDALRQALSLSTQPLKAPLDQVVEYLKSAPPCRIVLDNVEQIALGAALVIADLLARVPQLYLVVTSRRRLDLPGEQEVFVAPLGVPEGDEPELVAAAESGQLFLDRAQGMRPDFQVTPRNAADIGALCRLLDGVPLALELAAARAGAMTPAQIYTSLQERHANLSATSRMGEKDKRHRSLNAVVEWSFALLTPDLRRFFLALSVFRGGWETEAARAVTGEEQALDYLSRLRGHSLITITGSRFSLLETMRSWAEERLSPPEQDALAIAHAAYFATCGESAVSHTGGAEEKDWLDRLEAEYANLRAAFQYALQKEDTVLALRLALIRDVLGRARGSLRESLKTLETALRLSSGKEDTDLHARALFQCGTLHQYIGNLAASRLFVEEALPYARQSGNKRILARTLRTLADNAQLEKRYEDALPLYDEALALQRELNDLRGAAQTMNSLAMLRNAQGEVAEAIRLMQENGEYFRQSGDRRMLSYNMFNLAILELEQGNFAAAEALYQESLHIARELSDLWHIVEASEALAELARRQGQITVQRAYIAEALPLALEVEHPVIFCQLLQRRAELALADRDLTRAATLFAACETLRQASTETPGTIDQTAITTLRSLLGPRTFRAAWKKGMTLTAQEAVTLALELAPVATS